ncbi:hypothetical protein GCM10011345_08450 [Gemmobacter megaterium]|uniref:hypothetical protein n=1 Tax=Gemmobacter megaterium TaxID=1086013 RepID=UPI0019852309|nr:hypothetical protein [Gemmobacter megaterium]GGE05233.1 hypothetical protein GCM10011345_08450 [Gemmobacter megaterium]
MAIYLDNILDRWLSDFCVRPEAISPKEKKLAYIDKANLLYAVGILQIKPWDVLKRLNKIRNRFAHTLSLDVPEPIMRDFDILVDKNISDWKAKLRTTESGMPANPTFKDNLSIVISYAIFHHQVFLKFGFHNARTTEFSAYALKCGKLEKSKEYWKDMRQSYAAMNFPIPTFIDQGLEGFSRSESNSDRA